MCLWYHCGMKKLFSIVLLASFLFPWASYAQGTLQQPIKILIVPGHDNEVWGTQFGTIKEADMNMVLANQIYNILKKDKRFKVYITRTSTVGYVKEFADYFATQRDAIIAFKDSAKKAHEDSVASGDFIQKVNTPHNSASADTAVKLYGINKWASENNMDAVIHIHFNDYPRAEKRTIGEYKGFAIYFPDGEMPNSMQSAQLAGSIFTQLDKKYAPSNYPKEKGGLVPEQNLIAIGSNGTLNKNVNVVLIEYGYIYEKLFRKSSTRHQAYKDMAALTAKGITNYFLKK